MENPNTVSTEKIYEVALELKKHQEERRNKVNEYYTSLFGAMIAASPFIDKITTVAPELNTTYVTRYALAVLSLVGVVLCLTWIANLSRVYLYLKTVDEFIANFEKQHNFALFRYITAAMTQKNAPASITKYQFIIPGTFLLVFSGTLMYSLGKLLHQVGII